MTHGCKPRRIRWQPTDPIALAYKRAALVTASELASITAPLEVALKALREGAATEWHWSLLASAINCAMAIEKQGVVKGLHAELRAAELALESIACRANAGGAWQATAPYYVELDAIETAIKLHKFQLRKLSGGEVIKALDYAEAKVRNSGGKALANNHKVQHVR
jgi:hypothetical protein